jgi:hypothetical protein
MLKFNSDDAENLSRSLSDCKSIYTHELVQVQRNWQNLERTWHDYYHDEFSRMFEPILRSYDDSIQQINHHIAKLERSIGVTEIIQERLYDLSLSGPQSNHSSPDNTAMHNAANQGSEIPIIPPEILPVTLLLGFLICDANIIYNADERFRISDLRSTPDASHYSENSQKPIGDLGEKVVWGMLVDEFGAIDNERIQIKSQLESNLTEHLQNPDFYIPRNDDKGNLSIVVDAKAWKSFNSKAVEAVIKKYLGLEKLSDGGEIRIYFPSNILSRLRPQTLEKFNGIRGKVAVKILPMNAEHQELRRNSELIKLIFQMFTMPKTTPPRS